MGGRRVAAEGEHQRQGVLGRGTRVRFGGVGDDDAPPGSGGNVDVVDAGAGPADHLEAAGALDQVRRDLGGGANQDRVVLADRLAQLVLRHLEAEVDIEALAQQLDAGVGDLLLDEDLHLVTSGAFSMVQSMQAVGASTSAGPTSGNNATPRWVRPRFPYGSTSTSPLAPQGAATTA